MKDRKNVYEHQSEIRGADAAEEDPATEHKERARGDREPPNEIRTEERREQDGYGPRTHAPTRFTRKDGD